MKYLIILTSFLFSQSATPSWDQWLSALEAIIATSLHSLNITLGENEKITKSQGRVIINEILNRCEKHPWDNIDADNTYSDGQNPSAFGKYIAENSHLLKKELIENSITNRFKDKQLQGKASTTLSSFKQSLLNILEDHHNIKYN